VTKVSCVDAVGRPGENNAQSSCASDRHGHAFLGSIALAQPQAPPAGVAARPPAKSPVTARASPYRPIATVQDLMAGMIDPASKVVFKAVSSDVTADGVVETAPKNDDEWAVVRRNALMMVEGANLLMISGRHIAPPAATHYAQ
jgi:hypothetical protein